MPPAGGPCGQCQLVKATRRGDGASDEPPWLVTSHWQLSDIPIMRSVAPGPLGPRRASTSVSSFRSLGGGLRLRLAAAQGATYIRPGQFDSAAAAGRRLWMDMPNESLGPRSSELLKVDARPVPGAPERTRAREEGDRSRSAASKAPRAAAQCSEFKILPVHQCWRLR